MPGRDFHPDHNKLIEDKIREFADKMGYPLDHAYVDAYAGGGNVLQKLTAAVQAGDAPDVLTHNSLRPAPQGEPEAGAAEERFQSSPLLSSRRPFL